MVLLTPADKIEERKREYPGIEGHPLKFGAAELQTSHWRFLMGAVGNQATYIRQLNRVMKSLRDDFTLEGLRAGVESSSVPDHLRAMAKMRLDLAAEYIDDAVRLKSPYSTGFVDLRDESIEKDEALGLFVVLMGFPYMPRSPDTASVPHNPYRPHRLTGNHAKEAGNHSCAGRSRSAGAALDRTTRASRI